MFADLHFGEGWWGAFLNVKLCGSGLVLVAVDTQCGKLPGNESKSCLSYDTASCVQHGLKPFQSFRYECQVISKHFYGAAVKAVATPQLSDGWDDWFHCQV